jgi:hypothetical protein
MGKAVLNYIQMFDMTNRDYKESMSSRLTEGSLIHFGDLIGIAEGSISRESGLKIENLRAALVLRVEVIR